jgi:uncharacterized Rmd1/YagE family protein
VARALDRDVDLDRLAAELGIDRKFRWEEPMILSPDTLGLLAERHGIDPRVFVYAFGSVVFLNCSAATVTRFLDRMGRESAQFVPGDALASDAFALTTGHDRVAVTNDFAEVPGNDPELVDSVCLVLAKSVALERIESRLDCVFDEIEHLIDFLAKGRLRYPDERMARLTSMILSLQYTSLSHVMVLDKPEFTWENVAADELYSTMANLFELRQRYREIQHKSETLLDVTQVFSTLSHARRSTRLEIIVIVLILIEVVIYVAELLMRRG